MHHTNRRAPREQVVASLYEALYKQGAEATGLLVIGCHTLVKDWTRVEQKGKRIL